VQSLSEMQGIEGRSYRSQFQTVRPWDTGRDLRRGRLSLEEKGNSISGILTSHLMYSAKEANRKRKRRGGR